MISKHLRGLLMTLSLFERIHLKANHSFFYNLLRGMEGRQGEFMRKILVADPEEALCLLYQDVLTEEGYDVVSVTTPEDLMEAVAREKPDLVLMDMWMYEQGVRRLFQGSMGSRYRLPTLVCTTYAKPKAFREPFVNDTVIKSSNLDELKFKVHKIMGNGRKHFFQGSGSIGANKDSLYR